MKIIDIDSNNFKTEVLDGELVLVDFNASWCGPCRALKPILEELSDKYKIVSINVDDNMELAKEYGIFSIPCLIVFKNGTEVKRSIGLKSKEEIINMMEE